MTNPNQTDPLPTPFVVVIDTREQLPFAFADLRSDAREGRRPLQVRTEVRGLESGDYSLAGYEGRVAVERKSLADLLGTLGQGRERFERELLRLSRMEFAAVVVEATWEQVLAGDGRSQLNPKTVHRSVIAWEQRYPIRWWFLGDRRLAEITTFRILERFWREHNDGGRMVGIEGPRPTSGVAPGAANPARW